MYNLVVSGRLYIRRSDTQLLEDQENAKLTERLIVFCVTCGTAVEEMPTVWRALLLELGAMHLAV